MGEVLLTVGLVVACVALAVVILVARDAGERRDRWRRQEQRPLEDRIADIRASAAFMANQLQGTLDRRGIHSPNTVAWIAPVIAYYRRLEALAASPDASTDEIKHLADEAKQHVRQHRLKGVFVAQEAEKLAALVHRRGAG
jgi:hypothetical protein